MVNDDKVCTLWLITYWPIPFPGNLQCTSPSSQGTPPRIGPRPEFYEHRIRGPSEFKVSNPRLPLLKGATDWLDVSQLDRIVVNLEPEAGPWGPGEEWIFMRATKITDNHGLKKISSSIFSWEPLLPP